MLSSADWQKLVALAIERTEEGDLTWVEDQRGPARALSYSTSIDENTMLSIWGRKTGYSYQLELVRETPAEPFASRMRATTKKSSDGVDFSGLFRAIPRSISDAKGKRVFAALDALLRDPQIYNENPKFQSEWFGLETGDDLNLAQWTTILNRLASLTGEGELTWTPTNIPPQLETRLGDLLTLNLEATQARGFVEGVFDYWIVVSDEKNFYYEVESKHEEMSGRLWDVYLALAGLHAAITKPTREEAAQFARIIKDDVMHGVLASLSMKKN